MTAPGLVGVFVGRPITPDNAADIAVHLKVLADPARLQLLALITHAGTQGIHALDLIDSLNRLRQSTVSHHLRILEAGGFVRRVRDGRFVSYTTDLLAFAVLAHTLRGAR